MGQKRSGSVYTLRPLYILVAPPPTTKPSLPWAFETGGFLDKGRPHMDDLVRYIAVTVILKCYSVNDSLLNCAQQANAMLATGDTEGQRAWQRIGDAVRELTRLPRDGDTVN